MFPACSLLKSPTIVEEALHNEIRTIIRSPRHETCCEKWHEKEVLQILQRSTCIVTAVSGVKHEENTVWTCPGVILHVHCLHSKTAAMKIV